MTDSNRSLDELFRTIRNTVALIAEGIATRETVHQLLQDLDELERRLTQQAGDAEPPSL